MFLCRLTGFMKAVDFSVMLRHCVLCPRQCGVDRAGGRTGFCRAGSSVEIFRCASHHGEEPPISGKNGSGAIFFSRCTLRCLYCQNYPWSQEGAGGRMDGDGLAAILNELYLQGCHNWNLVSPTPWLPMIYPALRKLRRAGRSLPVVYNTSGYESLQTLRALENTVDIYLTDLRYASEDTARNGSSAPDYVKNSRAALLEMWRQKGALKTSPAGIAVSGTICRILVLPGLAEEACENVRWLAEEIGTDIALSLMAQYTPAYKAENMPGWNRVISRDEYGRVCSAAEEKGFVNGWIQDYNDRTSSELVGFNMPAMEEKAEDKEILKSKIGNPKSKIRGKTT